MKMFLFVVLTIVLGGCKVRKSEEVERLSISVDSLFARLEHKLILSRVASDSLYRVVERYDTAGRLSERETITQVGKMREQAVEQKHEEKKQIAQHKAQEVRRYKKEQKPAGLLAPSWWMLIAVGIIVGVWVSIRYFRIKL